MSGTQGVHGARPLHETTTTEAGESTEMRRAEGATRRTRMAGGVGAGGAGGGAAARLMALASRWVPVLGPLGSTWTARLLMS